MNRVCDECLWSNHEHAEWCQSRGYASVGPHPNAPVPETEPPPPFTSEEMCCGGTCVRALCFIHATEPRPVPKATAPCESDSRGDPEDPCNPPAFHLAGFTGRELTACGPYVQTFRDGKIVDEEPIEAYGPTPPAPTLWRITETLAALKVRGLISDMAIDVKSESPLQVCFTITLPGSVYSACVRGSIKL